MNKIQEEKEEKKLKDIEKKKRKNIKKGWQSKKNNKRN